MLDKLHAKHLLPAFADRSKEEQDIDRLTSEITSVRRYIFTENAFLLSPGLPRMSFASDARRAARVSPNRSALAGRAECTTRAGCQSADAVRNFPQEAAQLYAECACHHALRLSTS